MFTWRWRSSMWRQFVTSQTCVSGSQCLITSCLPGGGVHQCGDSLSPLRPASQDLNVRVHHIYLEVAFINVAAVCRLSDPRLRISMSEYIVFTWRWRSSMWRQFVASRTRVSGSQILHPCSSPLPPPDSEWSPNPETHYFMDITKWPGGKTHWPKHDITGHGYVHLIINFSQAFSGNKRK